MVAPYWTDLDPGAAGAVRLNILSDGAGDWIVVEYDAVKEYSSAATTSFQVWLGLTTNPLPDDVSITYGPITGNGDGGFLTVGAENRFGNRGQNVYFDGAGALPSADLAVSWTPPAPGGAVSFTFDASSKKTGVRTSTASMTSTLTPGVTQEVEVLTVTP